MFDFLFNAAETAELTLSGAAITVVAAIVLGLIISTTYMKTFGRDGYSQNFVMTLMMITPIIAIIILLVGSNVARAFSLAGAVSIIRFRSDPGDTKDIAYIFFALAAGLACGIGLIGYALLFTLMLCAAAVIIHLTKFGKPKKEHKRLCINIPENLNYSEAFTDIFDKYTNDAHLECVKSKEMGSVFELVYDIVLKAKDEDKEFLDALRCRNGNLSIMLAMNTNERQVR